VRVAGRYSRIVTRRRAAPPTAKNLTHGWTRYRGVWRFVARAACRKVAVAEVSVFPGSGRGVRGPCRRLALLGLATLAMSTAASHARAEGSSLPPEVGWNYGEIETPRSAAMGGALRAYSNSVSALFINPANMAVTRVYHLGALAQIWPEASRQSYGGAAVDSIVSSARLAGGFGGTWTLQDPNGIDRQATDLRFALAFPFSDQFFLGIGGRYLWLKQDGLGPLGDSLASGGSKAQNIVRGFAFDAGATVKPSDFFAISLVGNNLNNPGHGFQPTSVGGGVGVGTSDVTVEGDVLSDFTTWNKTTVRAMGGLEILIADHYPIRGGYRYDDGGKSHAVSAGLGYIDRTFAAEVAVRRIVSGDQATAIFFGFTYHLESSGLTPSADSF
jgi:opacity protein-like surface antigen